MYINYEICLTLRKFLTINGVTPLLLHYDNANTMLVLLTFMDIFTTMNEENVAKLIYTMKYICQKFSFGRKGKGPGPLLLPPPPLNSN